MTKDADSRFTAFVDRAFWTLIAGICAFGVHFLGNMARSVESLNEKMAVVVTGLGDHVDEDKLRAADVDARLRALEDFNGRH